MSIVQKVQEIIKPGDVILTSQNVDWYKPWMYVVKWGIQGHQKRIFGKDSDYKPTHTVMYFSPDKVFSMTFPKAEWETLEERCKSDNLQVFRYTNVFYADKHIDIMFNIAQQLIGQCYDIGDLFDFMIGGLLGYKYVRKIRWFEFSRKQMVCSTAVRTIQEYLRKKLEAEGDYSIERLFNKIIDRKYEFSEIIRTDVEMTTPAHYANSDLFQHEFLKVFDSRED